MQPLNTLTQINLDDLVASFGWQSTPALAALLRQAFHNPARKFAKTMLDFDNQVGNMGLTAAAEETFHRFARDIRIAGRENIPDTGSVLVLSNHPGMTDTLALFTAINRPDLQIIALQNEFLQALPNVSQHLTFIDNDPALRFRAIRKISAHLKSNGAALTFPAGQIEPDPAVYPGAKEALQQWVDSAAVFIRFAPDTVIVPALVSGVLWQRAVLHPLTRIKKTQTEREKLGAAFQLLAQVLFNLRPVTVTVQFGAPISAATLNSTQPAIMHQAVLHGMSELLAQKAPRA